MAEGELDTFISQIGDNYSWSVLLLQEAFVRTEGIVIDGGHQVYTSTELEGGLRCPAIIVHSKCTEGIEFAGGGSRWLAVTFGQSYHNQPPSAARGARHGGVLGSSRRSHGVS